MRIYDFIIKAYERVINIPPNSKKEKNARKPINKLSPLYIVKDVTNYIYVRISPYIKKERKVTKDKVALILFLFELYRLKNGLNKDDKFFSEWCNSSSKKDYVEDEEKTINFVKGLASANCIPLDKKIIEKVWDLELDYMISVGIIDLKDSLKMEEQRIKKKSK